MAESSGFLTSADLMALLLVSRQEEIPLGKPGFSNVLTKLLVAGLIEEESPPSDSPILYVLSAKGTAYLRMLLALPMPTKQEVWVHPLTGKPV